jgi:toxin FitB
LRSRPAAPSEIQESDSAVHVIILDTNVLSEMMRPAPSPAVLAWISEQRPVGHLFVTTITIAEILYGIEILPRGKRYEKLLQEAEATFAEDFADRILPFNEEAARLFAKIAAARRAQGRPIAELDAQIVAIAQANSATLVTRNTGDFEDCGVRLINPWVD